MRYVLLSLTLTHIRGVAWKDIKGIHQKKGRLSQGWCRDKPVLAAAFAHSQNKQETCTLSYQRIADGATNADITQAHGVLQVSLEVM